MSQLDATTPLGPFAIGALVAGRYRVDALLGAGAMGTVYRAYDGELDELVALKVLRAEASVTEDALRRFKREVKLARRVLHPNVARAYDLGVAGDLRFLTMELIGGSSLGERRKQQCTIKSWFQIHVVTEPAAARPSCGVGLP